METPCWCPSEVTETSVVELCIEMQPYFSRAQDADSEMNISSSARIVQLAKTKAYYSFFDSCDSLLGKPS